MLWVAKDIFRLGKGVGSGEFVFYAFRLLSPFSHSLSIALRRTDEKKLWPFRKIVGRAGAVESTERRGSPFEKNCIGIEITKRGR